MLAELGHTTSFWTYEPKASTRLLNAFLDSGKVDTSLYTPARVDFTPEITHTALGKGLAATMLALPVIVLISLLLMWRRVRRRGRIGRKASVVLRSVFPLVLGLGGWLAGVLVVLIAFPAVSLDDPALGVLSIGIPIGLGIYLAWVAATTGPDDRPHGSDGGRARRCLAGLPCRENGLMAVVTTIVGAAVGANLTLLVFDIIRERTAPEWADLPQVVLTPAEV